jgi:hypothetical protein
MNRFLKDIAYQTFILGRTKSTAKWHIVHHGVVSWRNQTAGSELKENVPFEKIGLRGGTLCVRCYDLLMHDYTGQLSRLPGFASMEKLK